MDESVLIGGFEQREIRIAEYHPDWPARYCHHAEVVAGALGDTLLRIEHIGSTSVPGLAAKSIIDILVVVADSADEAWTQWDDESLPSDAERVQARPYQRRRQVPRGGARAHPVL